MNELFKVYEFMSIGGNLIAVPVSVYRVRDDKNGFPHFLVYKDKQWRYISAKHYIPVDQYYYVKNE